MCRYPCFSSLISTYKMEQNNTEDSPEYFITKFGQYPQFSFTAFRKCPLNSFILYCSLREYSLCHSYCYYFHYLAPLFLNMNPAANTTIKYKSKPWFYHLFKCYNLSSVRPYCWISGLVFKVSSVCLTVSLLPMQVYILARERMYTWCSHCSLIQVTFENMSPESVPLSSNFLKPEIFLTAF